MYNVIYIKNNEIVSNVTTELEAIEAIDKIIFKSWSNFFNMSSNDFVVEEVDYLGVKLVHEVCDSDGC